MKQTKLMDWIKAEKVDFFSHFYKYLADNFVFWGVKTESGEYIWFCSLNESCQAGFIIQYITSHKLNEKEILSQCMQIIGLENMGY
jgi:hypothetical protein